ncbi:ATP-binding protein [Herpetosiphon giganteus]|uniref:ATP-binding protein n=1 Tax=Herpetosiphon giganteus TaxID=2029754 RepID=UPI00195629FE|nr:ATP-binding protein [Herpetosiphon giganteus]MBM7845390.1 DNA replication protein DnaC [Herpetosiphon giganteus]
MQRLDTIIQSSVTPAPEIMPPTVPWTPNDTCLCCKGAGYFVYDVPIEHPLFGKLQSCGCLQQRQVDRRRGELHAKSGLAPFQGKTFATFDSHVAGVELAVGAAQAFAANPDGFLTLVGNPGCGKTHLAQAIGNELQTRGYEVVWSTAPDALRLLRSTFDQTSAKPKNSFDEQFELFRKAPILLLDDLGAENATDWGKETLFQLLNERYEYQRPTVITSNLHPNTPDAHRRFGMRLCSRLLDAVQGHLVVLSAADYRQRDPMDRLGAA